MHLRKTLGLALLGAIAATSAFGQEASGLQQRVHKNDGQPMTKASRASHQVVIGDFLAARGIAAPGLELRAATVDEATGITHHRATQVVDGLRVFGVAAKIAVDREGRVRHAIENFVRVEGSVARAAIAPTQALDTAVRHLYGDAAPAMHRLEAEAVAIPLKGQLREGFLVEVWTEEDNVLYHVLVDGKGRVLGKQLRTASDSYKVFADNPDVSTQTTVSGPTSSPGSASGWLFAGNHRNIDIAGNNVNAYLDTDANNGPDSGGTTISDGNFVATANLGAAPSTTTNKAVAVQNLFYLNNVVHDKLYQHGFVESAGNFQESNGGLGGSGSDSVLAEAQDGSGTDNANFSTPSDGSNPRMQMYLWAGLGDHVVLNGGNTYLAMGAEFGPTLTTTGVTGSVVAVNDGVGTTSDGCESISTNLSGAIALIDRGNCDFVTKVGNAQNAGAIGVVVANNAGDDIITMGGTTSLSISSVFVGQTAGTALRTAGGTTTIAANPTPPLMKDGDLDSDIVYHEYGHGLTWRMIGNMSGPMSGAIGEGMSDVVAILMNGRDTVGSYSASNSGGIRSAPYTNYPRTYGDYVGDSVHHDGEIYAASIWRLRELFLANGISIDTLWNYLIQGMNYTVSGPTMENMRDGILQASPSAHDCLVWQAFAAYGIGEGATATKKGGGGPFGGGTYTVSESFTVPSACSGGGTNQAPTAAFSHSATNLAVAFTDSSSDADGSVVAWSWSFGDGATSTAQNPSRTYAAAGTYTVTLTVTDDDGATGSTSQSVTVTSGGTGGINLTASGYKVKGKQNVDLTWSGATSTSVAVYRNNVIVTTTANDGFHTDNIGVSGGGTYSYKVCEAGTSTCSSTVQVVF